MIRRPPRPPIKMMQPIALDLANSVTLLDLCGHNFVQLTPVCIPVYSFVQSRAHCTKSKSNMADFKGHT